MTTTSTTTHEPKHAAGNGAAAFVVEMIDVERIAESPLNPRKTYNPERMRELAASITSKGVLEPLVARPKKGANGRTHELVFGHRRLRAAVLAKVAYVPVRIASYTDEEALELQIVENGQRDDLHPLEEAEGYETLHTKCRLDVDTIAAKVGKSKAYVYARMKLCALSPASRKAFYDGFLNPSTALLVARLPSEKLQAEALKEFSSWREDGVPYRRAFEIIQNRFMLRLVDAPFDKGDKALVAAAGSCTDCPKRTGNQRELFADVKSPDTCTDPVCFGEKKRAHVKLEAEKLAGKGVKVVKGKPGYGEQVYAPDGFRSLEEYVPRAGKTLGDVLKGKKIERDRIVFFDGQGKAQEIVPTAKIPALLKAAGVKPRETYADRLKKDQRYIPKLDKAARELADLVDDRARDQLRTAVHKRGSTDAAWKYALTSTTVLTAEAKKAKGGKLVWLALEAVILDGFGEGAAMLALEDAYGVDRKKIEKAAKAELEAKAAAKMAGDAKATAKVKAAKKGKGKK